MSAMRASGSPCSSKISFAASTSRARVRAPLRERALVDVRSGAVVATSGSSVSAGSGGVLADLEGLGEGAAHDQLLGAGVEALHDLAVGQRVGHALGVGEVGAEHEPVSGQPEVEQALRIGLVEDVEVDVSLEHLEGILVEQHRR